jgi:hypothetical protein
MFHQANQTAQCFADRLDHRRYDDLEDMLDPECIYEFRDGRIQGASAIIESYRANTEWGFDVFDRIEFESEVFPESETTVRVRFSDHLFLGDADHCHVCEQVVTIDDSGRIIQISHCDLEGETDALDAFLKKCGVSRPSDNLNS